MSTVVMNNDPSKGAIDGNLKLHGTANCFESDAGICPVIMSGNTASIEQAIGLNGGNLIPTVALL
jgi:choline dehydrogenase-like flavoprotein